MTSVCRAQRCPHPTAPDQGLICKGFHLRPPAGPIWQCPQDSGHHTSQLLPFVTAQSFGKKSMNQQHSRKVSSSFHNEPIFEAKIHRSNTPVYHCDIHHLWAKAVQDLLSKKSPEELKKAIIALINIFSYSSLIWQRWPGSRTALPPNPDWDSCPGRAHTAFPSTPSCQLCKPCHPFFRELLPTSAILFLPLLLLMN